MTNILRRLWHSATLTTWASLALRTGGVLLVTPLILRGFSTAEIAIWYLLPTTIGLQILFELGFTPSFVRAIGYAMARPASDAVLDGVCRTMVVVYRRLSLALLVLLGIGGTIALIRPVSLLENPSEGWIAWAIVLCSTVASFRRLGYSAFLQGTDRIADLRRAEAAGSILGVIATSAVLLVGGGLVPAVAASYVWPVVVAGWNRRSCIRLRPAAFNSYPEIDRAVLADVWPAAWRSGLGIFMSQGVIQLSAVLYAQLGTAADVASFLLALRVLQLLTTASQAPFYTKLPRLARLYAEGNTIEQLKVAARGMALSHSAYAIGIVTVGVAAAPALKAIGSNASFIDQQLWFLIGAAFFVERYGAMHLQFYSLTNHIIWHRANGIGGAIYLLGLWFVYPLLGLYAFPAAIFAGYLGFYSWYAAWHSYSRFAMRFWTFERATSIPAALLIAGSFVVLALLH